MPEKIEPMTADRRNKMEKKSMNRNFVNLTRAGLAAAVMGIAGMAAAEDPIIVLPGDIAWRAAGASGMEIAILTGDPSVAGPYTFMVRVPQGTVIPPHSHPDVWRHSTIVSGTLRHGPGRGPLMQAGTRSERMTNWPDRTLQGRHQ
jgi:hypothetical protein